MTHIDYPYYNYTDYTTDIYELSTKYRVGRYNDGLYGTIWCHTSNGERLQNIDILRFTITRYIIEERNYGRM